MKASKSSQRVVHEVLHGQHRIIFFKADGTVDEGPWVAVTEIAHHRGHYAIVGENPLPQGVFTCRGVAHNILG